MLGQLGPTPFDLHFSLFGIPVRIHPGFWIVGILMGWYPDALRFTLIWVACLFVSILIHELGHALTAKAFGWPPDIVLYHFGGLATYMPYYGHTTGRSVSISLAGPGAGFVLFGIVWAVKWWIITNQIAVSREVSYAILQLEWINLGWGLVNLLPVLPLDGGQVSRELCTAFRPHSGFDIALKIAIVASGVTAFYFFNHREAYGIYPGLLFAVLCFQNFQNLQMNQRGGGLW